MTEWQPPEAAKGRLEQDARALAWSISPDVDAYVYQHPRDGFIGYARLLNDGRVRLSVREPNSDLVLTAMRQRYESLRAHLDPSSLCSYTWRFWLTFSDEDMAAFALGCS